MTSRRCRSHVRWPLRCSSPLAGLRPQARAAAAGAPRNPIAPVALPKVSPEAQAEFDEGVRIMKMGRKHYKDARKPLQRATAARRPSCSRPGTTWACVETALGNCDKAIDDFQQALDIQPGVAQDACWPTARACAARTGPRRPPSVYAKWLDSDPNDFDMRARYGQVLREAGDAGRVAGAGPPASGTVGRRRTIGHTVIAYNALALTYYKMGKLELAETALQKAADLDREERFRLEQPGPRCLRTRS